MTPKLERASAQLVRLVSQVTQPDRTGRFRPAIGFIRRVILAISVTDHHAAIRGDRLSRTLCAQPHHAARLRPAENFTKKVRVAVTHNGAIPYLGR